MAAGLRWPRPPGPRSATRARCLLHRRRPRRRAGHDRGGPPLHPARPRADATAWRSWPRTSRPCSGTPASSSPWPTTRWPCSPRAPSRSPRWRATGRPRGAAHQLGPRGGPEGRLRRLHVQGDPRAAPGRGRHAARPPRPDGQLVLDEMRLTPDELAPDRQGLHRGLRQQLPRRAGGQVRHRALGQAAHRGRHRQRVPLPGPGARRSARLCVGVTQSGETLDTSKAMDEASRLGRQGPGRLQRGRLLDGPRRPTACSTPGPAPRSAWPRPSATWPRSWPSRSSASRWPRCTARCPPARSRPSSTRWTACPTSIEEALRRAAAVDDVAGKLAEARDFFFLGRHVGYPDGARGRAQVEGARLPAGRGLCRRASSSTVPSP